MAIQILILWERQREKRAGEREREEREEREGEIDFSLHITDSFLLSPM